MDWSKAKTILIIAFIITNILLVYVIVNERHIVEPTLQDGFIQDVEELLGSKDITISTEIPGDVPSLNSMVVEYERVNINNLNRDYFEDRGIFEKREVGLSRIIREDESILLLNNRLIIYENKGEEEIYHNIDRDKAIQLAEEFIQEGRFETDDMSLAFVKEEKGVFYIEYSKEFDDIYIESAFTNIQVDSRGIKRFERLWLNKKDLGEMEIKINTAPKSLLTLLGMQEVYDKDIIDISLCYYFDPEKHEYLGEPKEAKQGNAIPAWRIQFEDGYKVFIDEY